jgi:hypothetical protein
MTQAGPIDPFGRLPRPENNLGIAGFICSILGIITCGLLAPVGLVLSLFALRREPKGFAVAGAVIGAVGSCGIIIGIVAFFTSLMMILAALGLGGLAVALGGAKIEAQIEMAKIAAEIDIYQQRTGQLPASLDLLPIVDPHALTDAWGNKYIYTLSEDGTTYELHSIGEDKADATADDIKPDDSVFFSESTRSVDPAGSTGTPANPTP